MTSVTQLPLFDNLEPKPKRCSKCGEWYPITAEFWYKHPQHKDGYKSECKQCTNKSSRQSAYRNQEKKNQRTRERYHENIEKEKIRSRDYRKKNYEATLQRGREWRKNNPEKSKEFSKKWQQSNRDKVNNKAKRWRLKYPEKILAATNRRRVRKLQAEGQYTVEDAANIYRFQKGLCKYCGADLRQGKHLDHIIPLSRGGNNWPTNLQYLCPSCNCKKSDKMPWELWPEKYITKNHTSQLTQHFQFLPNQDFARKQ